MPSSAKEDVDVEPLSIAPYLKPNELSGDGRKGKLSLANELVYISACGMYDNCMRLWYIIVACGYVLCSVFGDLWMSDECE